MPLENVRYVYFVEADSIKDSVTKSIQKELPSARVIFLGNIIPDSLERLTSIDRRKGNIPVFLLHHVTTNDEDKIARAKKAGAEIIIFTSGQHVGIESFSRMYARLEQLGCILLEKIYDTKIDSDSHSVLGTYLHELIPEALSKLHSYRD